MSPYRIIVALAVGLLLPGPAHATRGVRVTDVVEHYAVRGSTAQELAASIRVHGPTSGGGRRVAGNTTTAIE